MKNNDSNTGLTRAGEQLAGAEPVGMIENYFKAVFTPAHPRLGSIFVANTFRYAAFSEQFINIIGEYQWTRTRESITFSLPRDIPDGTHSIGLSPQGITANLAIQGTLINVKSGKFTFERSNFLWQIRAEFEFEFEYDGVHYRVSHGDISLDGTGPVKR